MRRVVRRSVRALLIDDDGRLVLIKRTKPGEDPYWTTPGGGVEADDPSLVAALTRELAEELGAEAAAFEQVFLATTPHADGVAVQHFFLCQLVALDEAGRHGPEFDDPSRGGYDIDRVAVAEVGGVALKPDLLRDFIVANTEALLTANAVG
jgi:ADP-ribose pyrophosphatase YjhB (NUDIX family)